MIYQSQLLDPTWQNGFCPLQLTKEYDLSRFQVVSHLAERHYVPQQMAASRFYCHRFLDYPLIRCLRIFVLDFAELAMLDRYVCRSFVSNSLMDNLWPESMSTSLGWSGDRYYYHESADDYEYSFASNSAPVTDLVVAARLETPGTSSLQV